MGVRWAIRAGLVVAVLGWLWPIGAGGRMPVGGDATQFSMGLMAFLGDSLRAGRWPLWNDLWGFGFPGLAESQMGVCYPPHWGYALVSTEIAYVASLVAHFAWGALGAAWAARRFGASEVGGAFAGFAWGTSGFFLIHLPHQWSYTVGSWMPWAWGLAWQAVRSADAPGRPAAWLAAVLAVQVLPGHFQLAFITEVGVLALAIAGAGPGRLRGAVAAALAVGAAAPLAAAQLWPTLRLAELAGDGRGFEYLSGFAFSPIHLISHVAPGLFHRSPLWRPLAWDVFHTAPEECLGYVGLVPLLLAGRAIRAGFRSRPEVRALTLVGLLTLALSLGPYFPGFRWLIGLPGFSFFRAPARWNLATSLALAILAGLGLDAVRRVGWARGAAPRFALGAGLAIALVVGGSELALRSGGHDALRWGYDALPWAGGRGVPTYRDAIREATRPQADLRVRAAQARLGEPPMPPSGWTLADDRGGIYARELAGTAAVLGALALLGLALARRPRALAGGLVVLTAVDLVAYGRARPFDLGPIRSLVAQSPVLARAAAGGRGLRTLDPAQNLFLVAGAESAVAYRTLTLPAPASWLALARQLDPADPKLAGSLRALGIDARVLDPFEARSAPPGWRAGGWARSAEPIRDPALAGWLFGADFARANRVEDFRWVEPAEPPARAWRVDDPAAFAGPDPWARLAGFRRARPLVARFVRPGHVEVDWAAASGDPPARVLVSQTYDPEWRGTWAGPGGATRPAAVARGVEGWQEVAADGLGPGPWTLHLDYEGRAARHGLAASALAWAGWLGWMVAGGRRRRRNRAGEA